MKRLNTRGIKSANKHVLLSAMDYNLKKPMMLKRPKKSPSPAKSKNKSEKTFAFFNRLLPKAYASILRTPFLNLNRIF